MKKIVYIIWGCVAVAFGAVGTVLPLLPSVPFILAMHKAISVLCVFFLAIYIFINHKKLKYVKKQVSL